VETINTDDLQAIRAHARQERALGSLNFQAGGDGALLIHSA